MSQSIRLNSQNRYEIKFYSQPDVFWLGWFGKAKDHAEVWVDNIHVTTISNVIRRLHGGGIVLISIRQV